MSMLDTIRANITKIDDLESRAMHLRADITDLVAPILDIIWPKDWAVASLSTARYITGYDIFGDTLAIRFTYSDGESDSTYIPLSVLQADDPVQAMRDHLDTASKAKREAEEAKERAQWERLNGKYGNG